MEKNVGKKQVKMLAVNAAQNFFNMQKNLLDMHLKLH